MALDFGRRTAVVQGNGILAKTIAERLRAQGAVVHTGIDGAAAVEAARKQGVDILILAVDLPPSSPLADLEVADLMGTLDAQLIQGVVAVQAALPIMRDADHGRIVACLPSSSVFGSDHAIAQAIAAAGLAALVKSVAIANLDRDVRANAISYIAATPEHEPLFDAHPVLDPALFPLDVILPAVTYLAHESCTLTGETISAGAGRFARLVTSIGLGGFDPALSDDRFAELLPKVMDTRATFSPRTVIDELVTIAV